MNCMTFKRPFRRMFLRTLILLAIAIPSISAQPQGILKSAELKLLARNAKTSVEHEKLARHYMAMAAKHDVEANEHDALAAEYVKNPTGHEAKHPMSGQTASHCKYYAEHCRKAANEMRSLAAAHQAMAKSAK